VGKTRFAVEAARQLSAVFADGVRFVALAGVGSPYLLSSAIAAALGVSLHGPTEASMQLASYLRDKQLLLVLDNFEHLLEGSGLLTSILTGAPRVTILVTSRERLNLQEEWVLPIEGLPYPETAPTAGLERYPAIYLFVQRARQLHAQFSPGRRCGEHDRNLQARGRTTASTRAGCHMATCHAMPSNRPAYRPRS
jgi:predicted ATPase